METTFLSMPYSMPLLAEHVRHARTCSLRSHFRALCIQYCQPISPLLGTFLCVLSCLVWGEEL